MTGSARKIFEFGQFCFDESDRLLLLDCKVVPLTPKAADTLLALVSRAGHVVERDDLIKIVWPDTFVEESSLTRNISQLRKALNEDEAHPYIETIPKRGYRFVAEVRQRTDEPVASKVPDPVTAQRPRTRVWPGTLFLAASVLIAVSIGLPQILRMFEQPAGLDETPFTTLPGGEYEPTFSPDASRIAFVWNGPEQRHFGIYYKWIKGGDPAPLVSDEADEGSPAWSPDGSHVAFVRYGSPERSGVYIVSVRDRTERRLTTIFPTEGIFDRKLDWSRDGTTIALADKRSAEEPLHIDLLNPATGERRRLTNPPAKAVAETAPVFSPDGRRIAFKRATGSGGNDIFVVPASGG